MSSDAPSSPTAGLPFLDPFADAGSGFARSALSPDDLADRARALLDEAFGPAPTREASADEAHGVIGVQADQTHYSEGFALFLGLSQGVAVAVRRASGDGAAAGSRVVFAPAAEPHNLRSTAGEEPEHDGLHVIRHVLDTCAEGERVEMAVAGTVPPICRDAALSALAVAASRALAGIGLGHPAQSESVAAVRDELLPALARGIADVTGRPTSFAYLLAAYVATPHTFLLVDTATHEHLPIETETPVAGADGALRWAVLDPQPGRTSPPAGPAFHRRRAEEAAEALDRLRASGVADVAAFRDLEHRDLQAAVDALPERLRPVARHLVTENRRVQKHVAALRRGDWQMIGALLLMSHASHRDHFGDSTGAVDALVEDAEGLTFQGHVYGACLASRDGAVLVTGRPPSFTDGLHTLADPFATRTGHPLRVMRP